MENENELAATENLEEIPAEESAPLEVVDEATEAQPAVEEQQQPGESNSGFQKRINKLTADKHRERRRADDAERELEKLKTAQQVVPIGGPPKLEDFDYDDEKFFEAKIDFKVKQATSQSRQDETKARARQVRDQANTEFARKIEASNIPDYGEVIAGLGEITPLPAEVIDAIQQDDRGPELAYYLGKHLDIADKIANASPIQAAMELGKLSAQLSSGKRNKITKAPAPVKPAASGGAAPSKSMDTMSIDEIMALP
jgi:hypothetical protein